MFCYRPWFGYGRWRRRMWRRHFWGLPGCGCLPLFALAPLLILFLCAISMCAGPRYPYYGY